MKLSLLKQSLIEKNESLPKEKRVVSNVREKFKSKEGIDVNSNNKYVINGKKDNFEGLLLSNQKGEMVEENCEKEEVLPDIDSIKIIGITGSRGKSSTAFLVHEYLESLGYKSILYSSIKIKSPTSYTNEDEACEVPLQDENILLNIIEEAEAYNADFIILEVNETAIEKGLIEGIPFTVRALTNINPHHNDEQYTTEEYINLKRSFFKNIPEDEDCTCVLGLTANFTREKFNEYMHLNNHPKLTYGTKYLCEINNANYSNIDCLLYHMASSIDGIELGFR